MAFLDLTKAFNCVNHHLLLNKLSHYGLSAVVLNWFKSYLSERKQFTKLNDTISVTSEVASGVPQGSVLGPILYLIYINDIGSNNLFSNILMFADDSVLITSSTNIQTVCHQIEQDLNIISDYFTKLKLGLNAKKNKIMYFDRGFKRSSMLRTANIHVNGIIEYIDGI